MSHIFLSYSTQNSEFADLIENELKENDYNVWRDRSNLRSGDEWADRIEDALNKSWFLFVIVSNDSKESRWVTNEVEYARNKGIPVIPILLEGEISFRLSDLQYLDFRRKAYDSLSDDVYAKLLEVAPKASLAKEVRLELLDGNSSERLSLVPQLRDLGKNPRSPKALAAKTLLEKLVQDEDELVVIASKRALQDIKPHALTLTQAKVAIEEVAESASNWSTKTSISVRNLLMGGIVIIAAVAIFAFFLSFFSETPPDEAPPTATQALPPKISVGQQEVQVYADAGEHFDILGIAKNQDLVVTGTSDNGQWHRVSFDGQDGWIRFTSNVTLQGDLGLVSVFAVPPTPTFTATMTPSPANTETPTITPTATPKPLGEPTYVQDFEQAPISYWDTAFGAIHVSIDENNNRVWEINRNFGERHFTLGDDWRDYSFAVDFRLTNLGNENEENVIAFKFRHNRFADECEKSSYEILYRNGVLQAGFACGAMIGSDRNTEVKVDTWHTIFVTVIGNQISWQLDDGTIYTTTDDTLTSGTVSLFASATNGKIQFDNIRIWH